MSTVFGAATFGEKQGWSFVLRVSASQVKLRRSPSSKRTKIESLSKFCLCTHCDTHLMSQRRPRVGCLTQRDMSYWGVESNSPFFSRIQFLGSSRLSSNIFAFEWHHLSVYWLLWMHQRVQIFQDSTTITDLEMGGRSSVNQIYSQIIIKSGITAYDHNGIFVTFMQNCIISPWVSMFPDMG